MKRVLLLGIVLALSFGGLGCAGMKNLFHHEPHGLLKKDARMIHPRSHLSDRHIILTVEQARAINRLYGQNIVKDGDLIGYIEAKRRRGRYGDKGNVYRALIETEAGPVELLVSTADGRVYQLLLKTVPFRGGKPLVHDEFLRQFLDRTLEHSWEMVRSPEDLLQVPARIRAMEGLPDVSRVLADETRKILIYDTVLTGD